MNLTDQFKYVNKVVMSCKTKEQKNSAHKWAWEWSKRTKSIFPNTVHSHTDLFLDVVSTWHMINKKI